jgi:outer membrane protein OmpA-like peptidoglycan-associated protein
MKLHLLRLVIIGALVFNFGCATSPGKKTAVGAGIGAVVGAGLGAVIGHRSGNKGQGALIGAAVGGMFGGAIGNRLDKQAKELAAIAETRRTDNGIITKLKGDILFASGKDSLRPEAINNLNQIAEIIKKYPEDRLRIVGHTDSDGSDALNATLSEKRAKSVRDQLIKAGFPQEFASTFGMGEAQPIASNTTADGKQLNRRVEIEITVDEASVPKK